MSIINKLVKQMVPVNVVKPLWYQAMVLSAVLLVGICAFLFFAGIRNGLFSGALDAWIYIQIACAFLMMCSSGLALLQLLIPGRFKVRTLVVMMGASIIWLFMWVFDAAFHSHEGPFFYIDHVKSCGGIMLGMAGCYLGAVLIYIIYRGALLRPLLTAIVMSFFVGSIGFFSVSAYCPIVLSMHTFQWHVMPLLVIVFIGTLIFQCVFKAIQKSKSK